MAKKWAAYVFAAALVFTSAACSSSDANKPAQTSQNEMANESNTSANSNGTEAKPGDPMGKYTETLKVEQVIGYGPPEDPKTPSGLTPSDNEYLNDLKNELNIEVSYKWAVPSEQYEQKFSLAVASGDLPDVMHIGYRDFEKFKKQGVLADLSEAYEKYASPELRQFMESDDGYAMKTVSEDGKLYGIPGFEESFLSTKILWLRSDWLKNVNMEAPNTIDDLEKIAEAFVNNDPDKNGEQDTYGLAVSKDAIFSSFGAAGLFYGYNSYPGGWIKDSEGKLVAGEIQPSTKTALEKLQIWYEKGILDKEFALKDGNKIVEDITAGKVGIVYGEWWYPNWPLNLNRNNDPNADWIAVQLPTADGTPGKSLVPRLRMGHIAVANSKFSNPEAVIKMINFYIEKNSKAHYETNKPENGYVYNWFVPRIYNPVEMETTYTEVNKALENNQDEVNAQVPYYVNTQKPLDAAKKFLAGDKSGWGLYYSRVAPEGGWGLTRKIRDNGDYVWNEFYGTATETMVEKGSQLDKMLNETFTKIIMGASIGEFDKFVDSWKALGGDDITDEVNAWYAGIANQ
ncbi:extracellular solute-binding protein [Paenibacillus chungangensis]|uniref:Extracellular solute-binding protein n=1 Tax=Paenibacillus chungangensis TaxID=696535 RepID=A0ABW3HP33_9BACL